MDEGAVTAVQESVDRGDAVMVSPITAWERGLLAARGRIASPMSPKAWFEHLLLQPGVELAELSIDILIESSFLPGKVHGDPADRIIIATARAQHLTIVTRDRLILDYADQGHVRALLC